MVDEYSNIDIYVPVRVVNGRARRDVSMLLFSKEAGYGGSSYYVYSAITHKFFKEDNIMRFLIANKITKLAKIDPTKKNGIVMGLGKAIGDAESVKSYRKMVTRNHDFKL